MIQNNIKKVLKWLKKYWKQVLITQVIIIELRNHNFKGTFLNFNKSIR